MQAAIHQRTTTLLEYSLLWSRATCTVVHVHASQDYKHLEKYMRNMYNQIYMYLYTIHTYPTAPNSLGTIFSGIFVI